MTWTLALLTIWSLKQIIEILLRVIQYSIESPNLIITLVSNEMRELLQWLQIAHSPDHKEHNLFIIHISFAIKITTADDLF